MPKIKQWNGTSWVTFDANNADTAPWSGITGKPTTLSGYGITDGLTASGGTMVGTLTLSADPTANMHAATKQYVDNTLTSSFGNKELIYDNVLASFKTSTYLSLAVTSSRTRYSVASANGILYFIGGYSASVLNRVEAFDYSTNTITTKATVTTARVDGTAQAVGNIVYYIGGSTTISGAGSNKIEAYDTTNNTWSTKSSTGFTGRAGVGSEVYNGIIYVFGGWATYGTPLSTVEAYTASNDTWSTKSGTGFTARSCMTCSLVGTKVYVIGGATTNQNAVVANNEAYDVINNTWSSNASLNTARTYHSAAVAGTKVHVVLGSNNLGSNISNIEIYDTVNNTYSVVSGLSGGQSQTAGCLAANNIMYMISSNSASLVVYAPREGYSGHTGYLIKPLKTPRRNLTAQVINSQTIYTIGGYSSTYSSAVESLDLKTNTWTTKSSMTTARSLLTSSLVGKVIYCIGGTSTGSNYLTTNEAYDTTTDTWSTKASMTTGRHSLTSQPVDGVIYCIGGYNGSHLNTVEAYNTTTNSWTTKASMTTARSEMTSIVRKNKIYVFLGRTGSSTYTAVNECYTTTTNSWTSRTSFTYARGQATASVVRGIAYVMGGTSDGTTALTYNESYHIDTNKVFTEAPLNGDGRYGATSVSALGLVFIIGGYAVDSNLALLNMYSANSTMIITEEVQADNQLYLTSRVTNGPVRNFAKGGTISRTALVFSKYDCVGVEYPTSKSTMTNTWGINKIQNLGTFTGYVFRVYS